MTGISKHTACPLWLIVAITITLLTAVGAFAPTAAYALAGNRADQATFKADLSYTGASAPEENFEVVIEALEGAPRPVNGESQSCALSFHKPQGEVEFLFSFDRTGIYRYQLSEAKGSNPRISYSSTAYLLEFEVYEDSYGLAYVVRAAQVGDDMAKPAMTQFDNTYEPPSSVLSDPPIKMTKSIAGDTPPEASTFVFVMEPEDASFPLPIPDSDAVKIEDGKVFVTVEGEAEVEIGLIEFTEPGIYRYHIHERDDRVAGYSYDDAVFDVIYTVTTDPTTGELVCKRDMRRSGTTWSGECDFTNTYRSPGDGGESDPSKDHDDGKDPSKDPDGGGKDPSKKSDNSQGNGKPSSLLPKTGDSIMRIVYAVLIAVVAATSFVVARKHIRRYNKQSPWRNRE